MSCKEYYCQKQPYTQEENESYNGFNHNNKCCCPCPFPCPCPKPEPPKPPHHCPLISAQLTYVEEQKVDEYDPFNFNRFDGVSITHANAPLYYDGTGIIFKKGGRFIITYGTVAYLDDKDTGDGEGNDVKIALKLGTDVIPASPARARNTDSEDDGRFTLSKTVLINITPGQKLQLVCLENDDEDRNLFKYTALVIDEKE